MSLDILLASGDDPRLSLPPNEMVELHRKPLVWIYLFQCEDRETYKQVIRPRCREWVAARASNEQEWLIVYVASGHHTQKSQLNARLGRTVFDKVKGDFEARRCVQLRTATVEGESSDGESSVVGMDDLTNRLREAVRVEFDKRLHAYEEATRAHLLKRTQPKWSFCHLALLKEGLAGLLETVGLKDEALQQFDELAAVHRSVEPTIFDRFGADSPGDDAGNVTSPTVKPFRQLLLSEKITDFDLRLLLFSHQAHLLLALNRLVELAERAADFVVYVGDALQRQERLPLHMAQVWQFCAATRVAAVIEWQIGEGNGKSVESVGDVAVVTPVDDIDTTDCSTRIAGRSAMSGELAVVVADLYRLALEKLRFLGVSLGFLPHEGVSGAASSSPPHISSPPKWLWITHPRLRLAVQSIPHFDELFISTNAIARDLFNVAGRFRTVTHLNANIGLLHFHRQRYDEAEMLFKTLCTMFYTDGWFELDYALRTRLAECQKHLSHAMEYAISLLGLLSPESHRPTDEKMGYVDELVNIAQTRLPCDVYRDVESLVGVVLCRLGSSQRVVLGADVCVCAELTSRFPKPVAFDRITLVLQARDPTTHRPVLPLVLENVVLEPGLNQLTFSAQAQTTGTFACEKMTLELGRLTLADPLRPRYDDSLFVIGPSLPTAHLEAEYTVLFPGVRQFAHVIFHVGEDALSKATLVVRSSSGVTVQDTLEGDALSLINGTAELTMFAANDVVCLKIPVWAAMSGTHDLFVSLQYTKTTRETFTTELSSPLRFVDPFTSNVHINRLDNEPQAVAHLLLRCSAPISLNVLSTTLRGISDTQLNDQVSTLAPGQEISYVWLFDSTDVNDVEAVIEYSVEAGQRLTWIRSWPVPLKISIEAELTLDQPRSVSPGTPIPCHFVVRSSTVCDVLVRLVFDSSIWAVVGCQTIRLVAKEASIDLALVPLASGLLQLPCVDVDKGVVKVIHRGQQVLVGPVAMLEAPLTVVRVLPPLAG